MLLEFIHTWSSSLWISHLYMNPDPGSTRVSNIQENSLKLCSNLRFCHQVPEFEKTSWNPKVLQKMNIFLLKNVNCNQRSTFSVYVLYILNIHFIVNIFLTKNNRNYKMGAWWHNLRLAYDSTLFSWIFDTSLDPGSSLWHYRLWSFQGRDTKLERFFHKNQQ